MKKYILFLFLCTSYSGFAQQGPNPFAESEKNNEPTAQKGTAQGPGASDPGGGNPGDPVPIDNYLPFLAIVAAGMIAYKSSRIKQTVK